MRHFVKLVRAAGALLAVGACADNPMMQEHRGAPDLATVAVMQHQQVAGCVSDGVCILDPLVVIGQPGYGGGGWGGGGGDGGGGSDPERGMCPTAAEGFDFLAGCGGSGTPEPILPGDSDNDGDTWDEGPGVWILCVSTILGTTAGGAGTYFALEDYHNKLDRLNAAKLRLDHHVRNYGASNPEYLVVSREFDEAEEDARTAAGMAAASAGVTIFGLIAAGVVCAPLILTPTL